MKEKIACNLKQMKNQGKSSKAVNFHSDHSGEAMQNKQIPDNYEGGG